MKQFFPPEIIEYTAESHFTKQGRSKRVIYVAVLPALKTCRVQFAFLLFFLLLIPELSFSKNLTIEGKIQNHKTNEPIPYANIAVAGSYYGTVSNENGDFRLVIPDKLSNKSISFYSIGYENFSIPINNILGVVNVFLKQFDFQITEVVVMPDSTLTTLIRKAYNRIPENYPNYPTRTIGFYRESLKQEDGDYLYLSEAILDCYKTSYENESHGQVKIVRSRKNKLSGNDTINQVHFYGGLFTPHKTDIVKNRSEIIKPSKDYSYKLEGMEMYNGSEVYCISFYPRKINKKGRIGKFFIDKKSLAFVKFDYRSNNEALKWREKDQPLTFLSSKEERFVRNYESINGTYYLKSVFYTGKMFNKKTNQMLEMTDEYIVTEINVDSAKQIPYSEQVSYTSVIADVAEDYQLSNWKDYSILEVDSLANTLLANKEAESILSRVNPPSKREKMEKLFNFISRFESEISMVAYPVSVSNGDYALQFSLTNGRKFIYHSSLEDKNFFPQYELGIKYKLTRNWKLFFNAGENILSSEKASSNIVGIEYTLPLKTYGKKIFYSVNVGYGFLKLMKTMGTVNNDSEFKFGGKFFNSKQIEAYRGIDINGIRLGSDLSFQLTNFIHLKLFGGWQFNSNQAEKIRLEERKGFFLGQKTAEENLSNEGIKFSYNGKDVSTTKFTFQNYFIGLGLKYSF